MTQGVFFVNNTWTDALDDEDDDENGKKRATGRGDDGDKSSVVGSRAGSATSPGEKGSLLNLYWVFIEIATQ